VSARKAKRARPKAKRRPKESAPAMPSRLEIHQGEILRELRGIRDCLVSLVQVQGARTRDQATALRRIFPGLFLREAE
jgi:hypothetical protein